MNDHYTKEEINHMFLESDEIRTQMIALTRAEFEDIKSNMLKLNERVKSLEAVIQKLKESN